MKDWAFGTVMVLILLSIIFMAWGSSSQVLSQRVVAMVGIPAFSISMLAGVVIILLPWATKKNRGKESEAKTQE